MLAGWSAYQPAPKFRLALSYEIFSLQPCSRNVICPSCVRALQGGLYYWSYLYYLSKYYELLDTLLIVLKVPPPCLT